MLNNIAVTQFQRGELDKALTTFRQAFTVMPKNAAIALNLLQTTAAEIRDNTARHTPENKQIIFKCMETLEAATLSDEQDKRYRRVKATISNFD